MHEFISTFFEAVSRPINWGNRAGRPEQLAPSIRRPLVDHVMSSLVLGFDLASEYEPDKLAQAIQSIDGSVRPIVWEGAYSALAAKDVKEGNRGGCVASLLLAAPGTEAQMHCGLGGSLSDLQLELVPTSIHESFFGWVAMQSRGCRDGYFRWPSTILKQSVPADISGWARCAYDEGIGAAIWYIGAAEPHLISSLIDAFPDHRRHYLWRGFGTVIGLWGMHDEQDLRTMPLS